ncbi:hypothetical protein amb1302 [Paramagnetospirillum magneticum AMB-1]|uniref:Uncharacterized protein n=1 Tax=Paramagnetospirillum magneticum (strain ATCC 700264 / AMB-1) TaxID=342108 RepID=Q2W7R8_PARM1|nr:hypothetical protein amb1302 [Paramagnetospirillum magneticum AMB-1]
MSPSASAARRSVPLTVRESWAGDFAFAAVAGFPAIGSSRVMGRVVYGQTRRLPKTALIRYTLIARTAGAIGPEVCW